MLIEALLLRVTGPGRSIVELRNARHYKNAATFASSRPDRPVPDTYQMHSSLTWYGTPIFMLILSSPAVMDTSPVTIESGGAPYLLTRIYYYQEAASSYHLSSSKSVRLGSRKHR